MQENNSTFLLEYKINYEYMVLKQNKWENEGGRDKKMIEKKVKKKTKRKNLCVIVRVLRN